MALPRLIMESKRRKFRCDDCFQSFNRIEKLGNHRKKAKVKCSHCEKTFCNVDLLEKHKRSITTPADEINDLDQKLQPRTGYGTDAGLQVVSLGKVHDIRHLVKKGLTWKIINIPDIILPLENIHLIYFIT